MSGNELVLATNNSGKIREMKVLLGEGLRISSLEDMGFSLELPETSGTISGNAAQKAFVVWDKLGVACLADDSGLEVNALGGKPGVDSAFFAGHPRNDDRNMAFLLDQMEGVADRSASFVTVLALVVKGELHLFEGRVNGRITNRRQGTWGFGYDPVFIPDGQEKTFAEMTTEEKNRISHRAKALVLLKSFLENR
jgi:XTP/dITP diphosphohydrolase